MINIEAHNNYEFLLFFKEHLFFRHTVSDPFIVLGYGKESFNMNNGVFEVSEELINEVPLRDFKIITDEENNTIISFPNIIDIQFKTNNDRLEIEFDLKIKYVNRLQINLSSVPDEYIYGCGEQYSFLNLKGKKIPLWSQEKGIGRDRNLLTYIMDIIFGAGGKNYTTYFSQPTFISTSNYFCHVDTFSYAEFDFLEENLISLYIWDVPEKIVIDKQNSTVNTITSLTNYLGKQPELPDWMYEGVILGLKGGSGVVSDKLNKALEHDIEVCGVLCEDWAGDHKKNYSNEALWDWEIDKNKYSDLPEIIKSINKKGIKFLGYVTPFISTDKEWYKEATSKGYVVKTKEENDYLFNINGNEMVMVDLTNNQAKEWFKKIIKNNMVKYNMAGWHADFGEYLPVDGVLCSEKNAIKLHNEYPILWAKLHNEILNEVDSSQQLVFFNRSGYSGTSKFSPLIYSGNQLTNWNINDGFPATIMGALSLGFTGIGFYHSAIGGTNSTLWIKRSKELFLRWMEQATFTIVMRTDEGTHPEKNWQFYSDQETINLLAKMSYRHKHLRTYIKYIIKEYSEIGLPAIRHPFIHYEEDKVLHQIKYQYLFGRDLLVAPIYNPGKNFRKVYFPNDTWVSIWDDTEYENGWYDIESPIGYPPVFFRRSSEFSEIFKTIKKYG